VAAPSGYRAAVIGEEPLVRGFALAGAHVLPAAGADEVRAAWGRLTEEVAVVVLTEAAAAVLADLPARQGWPFTVVMRR
jgi:vacuolar-type H+-ATPase subunit F/Vma7